MSDKEELSRILKVAMKLRFRIGKDDDEAMEYLAGIIINAGFTRPGSPQKESLNLEKVLEEFDKEFANAAIMMRELIDVYKKHKNPRFVEVGDLIKAAEDVLPLFLQRSLMTYEDGLKVERFKAAVEKAKGQPHDAD